METEKKNEPTRQTPKADGKQSAKTNKVLVALVVVLLVAVCVIGYLLLRKPAGPQVDGNVITSIDPGAVEQKLNDIQDGIAENELLVSMPAELIFQNGGATGYVGIENDAENHRAFVVEIILNDGGKSVLKTGLIPVGSMLENATLSEKLTPGRYPASAIYTTYDDTGLEKSKVGVAVTVVVES